MSIRRIFPIALFFCLFATLSASAYPRQDEISRGRYLAAAGDCVACHSDAEHPAFSGNRPIPTPFGTIYSTNITSDRETGIGSWTEADFYRALHEGVGKDGENLYPAMPYVDYTKLSREDVDALYAYFTTVPAAHNETMPPKLIWPLTWRPLMGIWKWMFFKQGAYQPDLSHSEQWNRGAFLVEGLGHCGDCHTERNFLGATRSSAFLQGGVTDHWFAPALVGNTRDGLGHWSADQIVQFLKTGRNDRTAGYGPMGEVIADSTRYMTDGDLAAIATFLKSQKPEQEDSLDQPDGKVMNAGGHIFEAQCAACHQPGGTGIPFAFASLRGNANAQARNHDTVLRAILTGVRTVSTGVRPTGFAMPAFDWKLNDSEIAAVATYIGNTWGNAAPSVSESDVATLRDQVKARPQFAHAGD